MENVITKEKVATLLGRSLSSTEERNYKLYLNIAKERLEDLLCISIDKGSLTSGLELLLARCFATITQEQAEVARSGIRNKKIEDYSVTYDEDALSPMEVFVKQNDAALEKYSKCQAEIRHGRVAYGRSVQSIYLR